MGSMTHRVLKPHRSKMSTIYMYVIMNIYIYVHMYEICLLLILFIKILYYICLFVSVSV